MLSHIFDSLNNQTDAVPELREPDSTDLEYKAPKNYPSRGTTIRLLAHIWNIQGGIERTPTVSIH